MFGKQEMQASLRHMEFFHESNMYLPNRTVYFGGTSYDEDEVTSTTVAQTIKNLQILESQEPGKQITLFLNSCGGEWYSGIALYDLIKSLTCPVLIIGMGQIFSMASIILQAGDYRVITKHTAIMIHDGEDGYVGSPKSMEAWAKQSKITREQSYVIYFNQMVKKNPKITMKKIEDMCVNDTIFNSEEAINAGLADFIMEDVIKDIDK